jgi:phage-related protein
MGDSRKNIRSFPVEVRTSVGYALQLLQAGETPTDAKPFKGVITKLLKQCQPCHDWV